MARIIGGALCFGSTLLNPGPSEEDLQKQLKVTKAKLDAKGNSDEVMRRLIQEIKDNIENPASELKTDFYTVRCDMKDMYKKVWDSM